jgi:hypothetical protein
MKRHLMIAGTGRAGTTFLVQYLHGCGLETHLTTHPKATTYEQANAGLEDVPIKGRRMPYVIKTPWLFEFVDRFLSRKDIAVDVAVLPMRDLVEVASSRVTLELRERYAKLRNPDVMEECTKWETWGKTPGGMVYSLNPIDQARILAVGFHQVIHAFVKRGVPILFLDFPRMINDGDYLFQQLKPYLGDGIDKSAAMEVFHSLAEPDLVRVGAEISQESPAVPTDEKPINFPSFESLDRAALLRELKALKVARLPLHKRLFRSRKRIR